MTIKNEKRPFHPARHVKKHLWALDNYLFGTPVEDPSLPTRSIENPEEYIKELEEDRRYLLALADDVRAALFHLGVKGLPGEEKDIEEVIKIFSYDEAVAYAVHDIGDRSLTYSLYVQYQLAKGCEDQINLSKAQRVYNYLIAAIEDETVALVRFMAFAEQKNK